MSETIKAGGTRERTCTVAGVQVHLICHRVGKMYSCHVDNIDPGTVIGRAIAPTADEAETNALRNAEAAIGLMESLGRTRSVTESARKAKEIFDKLNSGTRG